MTASWALRICIPLCLVPVAKATEISDMQGTWHVAGMGIPGSIIPIYNEEGIVMGLAGGLIGGIIGLLLSQIISINDKNSLTSKKKKF